MNNKNNENILKEISNSLSFITFHFVIIPILLLVVFCVNFVKGIIPDEYLPNSLQEKPKVEKMVNTKPEVVNKTPKTVVNDKPKDLNTMVQETEEYIELKEEYPDLKFNISKLGSRYKICYEFCKENSCGCHFSGVYSKYENKLYLDSNRLKNEDNVVRVSISEQ